MIFRILRFTKAALILGVSCAIFSPIHAATYTWDPSNNGSSGGTGNWNLTDSTWYNGSADIAWPNPGTDTALFAGTAGTVTTTASIQVGTLTFNTAGYILNNGSGGSLTLSGSAPTINGSASSTIGASLTSAANVTFNNTGLSVTALTGTNSFTNGVTFAGGTVNVGSAEALGDNGTITFANGIIQFSASNTTDYSSRFSTAVRQNLNIDTGGQTVTFASNLTSSGGTLSKIGSGTLILTGTNSFTGVTSIPQGTLQIGNNGTTGTLGTGSVLINAALVFDRSDSIVIPNTISGTGTLTQNTAATLTLTGANSYSGGTVINAGTLQIGTGGISGALGTGNVTNRGALVFDLSSSVNVASVISGVGTVTQAGTGTLTLTGASTYTGNTTINNGTLIAGNTGGSATGTGAVTVSGSSTLGGNGTISGPVTIQSGGTLAPGQNAISKLTLGSNLALNSGSTLAIKLDGTVAGTTYDQVRFSGMLTLGGNLRVSVVSGFSLAVGQTFVILDGVGGSAVSNGAFANDNGFGTYKDAAGNTYSINYAANADNDGRFNDVTLTVISVVPEPSTWLLVALGASAGLLARRSRKKTLSGVAMRES